MGGGWPIRLLHFQAYKGRTSVLASLIRLEMPVGTTDSYGQTPLHLASLRGNLDTVEYLVLQANVSRQTDRQAEGRLCYPPYSPMSSCQDWLTDWLTDVHACYSSLLAHRASKWMDIKLHFLSTGKIGRYWHNWEDAFGAGN